MIHLFSRDTLTAVEGGYAIFNRGDKVDLITALANLQAALKPCLANLSAFHRVLICFTKALFD